MSHSFAGCASTARSTFPTSARRMISQRWVPPAIARTFLAVPLRQQGELIGGLFARRIEVRPFTPAQIKLLETFADQAVIAIENVRLFQELKDHLEQQTATSEILGVIASSPTDIQPVLDVVAENAARLCDATDAVIHREWMATCSDQWPITGRCRDAGVGNSANRPWTLPGRAMIDRQNPSHRMTWEMPRPIFQRLSQQQIGVRTVLGTPLLREGIPIGAIHDSPHGGPPFHDKQIKLLKTFADQAVIAIENVRLFQELEARTRELAQSVGELKALGEVGQAVSSTLDLQTVLSTIVGHAVQLSGTRGGVIYEYDEATQEFHLRASHRMEDELVEALRATPVRPGQGATDKRRPSGRQSKFRTFLDQREYTATRCGPCSPGSDIDLFWRSHCFAKSGSWAR